MEGQQMQFRKPLTATAVALGMTFGGAAVAQDAQTEAPATAPLEAPAEAAAFTEEQLQSFVAAALEVSGIQQQAAADLMATEDETEQDEVLQQANQQMIDAIESEPGITVPEYIAIAEAAETDPALRTQLEEMIVAAQTTQ
jgi:hypothetical protein